jgi:hypothetical protein
MKDEKKKSVISTGSCLNDFPPPSCRSNTTDPATEKTMSKIASLEDEFVLDEYEAFDDYLEMVLPPLSHSPY